MAHERIFDRFTDRDRRLWGKQPIMLRHSLHHHPLFSLPSLGALIDSYPSDKYVLVQMGEQGSDKKLWKEGKIRSGMRGAEVIEHIRNGRLWINLLHVNEIVPEYQQILDDIYQEIHAALPDMPKTYKRICGILISSPRAQVYYHFDTTGQNLWQIHGSKRVYLYPPEAPFLREDELSDVTLYHNEVGITYERWYDEYARQFYLQPGTMVHWPLNAPHRIENGDELSVSLTTEYYTWDIRKHTIDVGAAGLLRPMIDPNWVPFPLKAAVLLAATRTGMLGRRRSERRPVTFEL